MQRYLQTGRSMSTLLKARGRVKSKTMLHPGEEHRCRRLPRAARPRDSLALHLQLLQASPLRRSKTLDGLLKGVLRPCITIVLES